MNDKNPANPALRVKLGKLELENPVIAASGTFGYGLEFTDFVDLNQIGGFATKGLSFQPRLGNPAPRVVESGPAMLNAIGLENIGYERFVVEKLPLLQNYRTRVICNFFGNTVDEYIDMAKALSEPDRIDALEMNISCPNVKEGGVQFSSHPRIVEEVVSAVRKATDQFLIVKLSPNVTDITEIAKAAERAGADALSLINTFLGMSLDAATGQPYLANVSGGVSGPGIKPMALHMVYQTAREVQIPVIGIGGIRNTEDALEFLMAGASAIQVGTANFFDPEVTMKIVKGLEKECQARRLNHISELYAGD